MTPQSRSDAVPTSICTSMSMNMKDLDQTSENSHLDEVCLVVLVLVAGMGGSRDAGRAVFTLTLLLLAHRSTGGRRN